MNIRKTLRGLLFEDDSSDNSVNEKETAKSKTTPTSTVIPVSNVPVTTAIVDESEVNTMINKLSGIVLKPGNNYDFSNFMMSVQNISMFPSEQIAYAAFYSTAATMGVTKDSLLGNADDRLKLLSDEHVKFNTWYENEKKRITNDNAGALTSIENERELLSKQISELNDKLNACNTKLEEAVAKRDADMLTIEKSASVFTKSVDAITSKLSTVVAKINQYIS